MYISIDIGGTNTRIATSENLDSIINLEKFPTPKTKKEISLKISKIIESNPNIKMMSVGVAGFINRHTKHIIKCPHIPCLDNTLLEDLLGPNLHIPTYLENDAALAGLAETIRGEGANYNRVAYITISTGVGGTLIENKKISDTKFNFEPGHHIIDLNPKNHVSTMIQGSWESYSSGTAFKDLYNIEPDDYNDKTIWTEYGKNLAVGLHNISLLWNPDVIILGGSLSKKATLFLKVLEESLNTTLPNGKPDIKISQLSDSNGILGGLELIRQSN